MKSTKEARNLRPFFCTQTSFFLASDPPPPPRAGVGCPPHSARRSALVWTERIANRAVPNTLRRAIEWQGTIGFNKIWHSEVQSNPDLYNEAGNSVPTF